MIERKDAITLIKTEYNRLDKICNVDTSGVKLSLSGRMTRGLGVFNCKRTGFSDELSIRISDKTLENYELFYDVIRHEYAHAVVHIRYPHRKHNHDDVWKAVCLEVGCLPKATQKVSGMVDVKSRSYKYLLICKNCGAETRYTNQGKIIKIMLHKKRGMVICKRCGSKNFVLEYLSEFS